MSRSSVSGHFIEGAKGPLFVLLRRPVGAPQGCVLVVPPFAEEMNKCRRMVSEVTIASAEQGMAVMVPDLYGTGDSSGRFEDADWATWRADLATVCHWSRAAGHPVTALLAVRLGCALAVTALESAELPPVERSVLWQPLLDGGRFLSQFLRLRIAAGLMEDRKETLGELKVRLAAGEAIEVAGYRLSSRLAMDLEAVSVYDRLPTALGDSAWLEVVRGPDATLSPPSLQAIELARSRGLSLQTAAHVGEPFWSSTEIVVNLAMVAASVSHLIRRSGDTESSR